MSISALHLRHNIGQTTASHYKPAFTEHKHVDLHYIISKVKVLIKKLKSVGMMLAKVKEQGLEKERNNACKSRSPIVLHY